MPTVVLAAAASVATDPLALLLNYGPLGIVGLLFAAGYIVAKPTHASVIKERDDLKAENKALTSALIARQTELVPRADLEASHKDLVSLRAKMEDQMIPGMFQYTATLDRALTTLSRLAERAPI